MVTAPLNNRLEGPHIPGTEVAFWLLCTQDLATRLRIQKIASWPDPVLPAALNVTLAEDLDPGIFAVSAGGTDSQH